MTDLTKILLVDDDPSIIELLEEVFINENFQVLTALDGNQAKLLFDNTVDCVVTDIAMPIVDGVELYTHVRALGSAVPFIMMSGFHGDIPKDYDGILFKKPVKCKDLVLTIRKVLR